jgi:hypothetical protein
MNLAQARRLKVGDSFARPSTNPHDNGNRVYTVCSLEPYLEFVDQHGYHCRAVLNAHDKPFFKDAVKLEVAR